MSSILFEIKNAVAYITLNRPDKFNSFNREMALLMQAKLDEAAASSRRLFQRGAAIRAGVKAEPRLRAVASRALTPSRIAKARKGDGW